MVKLFTSQAKKSKPKIDNASILEFFDTRAKKINTLDHLRVVMYQDNNPDLVVHRDVVEKDILLPKLKLDDKARILDVGCGTGRWLDSLDDNFAYYHGIDISKGFISYAQNKFKYRNNIRFSVASVNNLSLEILEEKEKFTQLLCIGVLMYLNDEDLIRALQCINDMMDNNAKLIFREPIALVERLTLINEYSEDMQQSYSAIYRTKDELIGFFNLYVKRFRVSNFNKLFDDKLNNRKETQQYYFILESMGE